MESTGGKLFEQLRQQLLAERERLVNELGASNEVERELGAEAGEEALGTPADEASDTFEQEKHLALQRHLQAMLDEVEHALRKLAEGTYGRCDRCGADIPQERLEILPQAALCIVCKETEEKVQHHGQVTA